MAVPALLLAAAVATFTAGPGTDGAVASDPRAPLVTVTLEFPVGTWSPWARAHHADVAFTFQDDDPERALRKRADALAATIDLDMGSRSASLTLRCLKDDLAASLALVKDILANTRYDVHELKREKRERQILWRGNETDVGFRMAQATARGLYAADDPRRLPLEHVQKMSTDPKTLAATRDVIVRLPGRMIAFAGDVTLAEAQDAAAGLLPPASSERPPGIAPELRPIAPAASRAREQDVAIRRLTQVYLALGRDSLPWTDPRRPAFLVADHVLAGHFYSRLYVALRHDAGDTYGAGSTETGDVVPGSYAATTFTRLDNAKAIEAKLTLTMTTFRERGITEEERAAAISYLRGNQAFDRQSAGQIMGRYLRERRLGLADGDIDRLVERAAEAPLDEINAFIREFYDPAQLTMLRAVPK